MNLHHHFINSAKRMGSKHAFIDCSTNKKVEYSRALIATLMLSDRFSSFDKGFLGIMLPTSAGCALSVIGTLMSGRTPVMINYSGAAHENAIFAQKKCDFRTIITSQALIEKIQCPAIEGMVFIEDIMKGFGPLDKLKALMISKMPTQMLRNMVHQGPDDENCVILFTSGSEKEPKAVQLTHRNIESNVISLTDRYKLAESDSFLANLPYFHVFGLTANLWAPMMLGMTAITYANPVDYKTICEIIRREKPNLVAATPSFFWGYLRKSEPGDFDHVRLLLSGADKCPDALRKAYMEKHGATLLEAYGATETSPAISGNSMDKNKPGSVGLPIDGVEVRIEHHETGEDCPVGEVGRILVKGPNVMKGYFDDFEQTAMHIRHGWYDTGDMGVLDEDGYLWHVGRLRRFIKIGGEMVSLVKVENVLEGFLPEGVECCVVEVPDAIKGSKIVAVTTAEIDQKEILKKMAAKLPNIALPKQFMVMEEFPKMGSGKIDFRTTTDLVRDIIQKTMKK